MQNVISYQLNQKQHKLIKEKLINFRIENHDMFIIDKYRYYDTTISIYSNLKLLIQGKNSEYVFKHLNIIDQDACYFEINSNYIQFPIIGCDEVGVGDFFGGLVTACVFLNEIDYKKALKLKINDSKKMNDNDILKIYPFLTNEFKYCVASLSPSQYNKLYSKYKNNHILKTFLHNKGLTNLVNEIGYNSYQIVMDAYVPKQKYNYYLDLLDNNIQKKEIDIFETNAESKYIAVAIASMIARGYFLTQMKKLNDKFNIVFPLGINYEKIYLVSEHLIKNFGKEVFDKLVKQHFKTYSLVLKKYDIE